MATNNQTRHSLLQRATDLKDEDAWEQFAQQYHRFILCVLHQLGVPRDDLEDLTQQVLIALTRDLPRYDRDRARFRTWLSTIIRNKANSYFRKQYSQKRCLDAVSAGPEVQQEFKAPDIAEIIEKEWAAYIGSLAMKRVKESFQGQAIEVFELGLDGHSAAEIAEKTNLTVATVYTLKKRVKKRLYLEIRNLASELE
ncbi:sigma-70 family RNA polymerase sigma factor [Roseibacillus persicicus]|uniref:RNA polymerase sigma factor SigS n=2 Tax=Roseibacillus persicicus TaxID=454148 RepID=A0A918WFU1_9BACT|nr:sigma-70 family RNA polymerase sigma factor [Roseibacillus persicicus]GHC42407.1 DNA-directed RNA polymerase sigma-70 factor [Roseibacillus persicicus]